MIRDFFTIPDPWSWGKKGTESRIRIRNTGRKFTKVEEIKNYRNHSNQKGQKIFEEKNSLLKYQYWYSWHFPQNLSHIFGISENLSHKIYFNWLIFAIFSIIPRKKKDFWPELYLSAERWAHPPAPAAHRRTCSSGCSGTSPLLPVPLLLLPGCKKKSDWLINSQLFRLLRNFSTPAVAGLQKEFWLTD